MNIFIGWRDVGRAMRWARRQDGVTVTHDDNAWFGHEWDRSSADTVSVHTRQQGCSVMVDLADGRHVESGGLNAATALRVLAALDVIPAELAEARDERYGRCVKCDRLARWWEPDGIGFEPRWVHVNPLAVSGPAAHRAVVSEINTDQKDVP